MYNISINLFAHLLVSKYYAEVGNVCERYCHIIDGVTSNRSKVVLTGKCLNPSNNTVGSQQQDSLQVVELVLLLLEELLDPHLQHENAVHKGKGIQLRNK